MQIVQNREIFNVSFRNRKLPIKPFSRHTLPDNTKLRHQRHSKALLENDAKHIEQWNIGNISKQETLGEWGEMSDDLGRR